VKYLALKKFQTSSTPPPTIAKQLQIIKFWVVNPDRRFTGAA